MEARQCEIFVNVPAQRSAPETSFEELRIRDYITAYSTTGEPPQPIPPEPADPAERARLGLPPLWVPYSEVNGVPVPLSAQRTKSDPTTLPEIQVFEATGVLSENGQPQYMHNIVCQSAFSSFSPEELRYRAYWTGKKYAPEAVQKAEPASVAVPPVAAPVVAPTLTAPTATANGVGDALQSITCQPQFALHSFEELRLACYRTRHELTSEQIVQARVL